MSLGVDFDTSFDFRADTPHRKDPDAHSPTLRSYHQRLWSKPLPSGDPFPLSTATRGAYLHHQSGLGEFCLTSDSAIPSFRYVGRFAKVAAQLPESEIREFQRECYTIGAMTVWPGTRVGRQWTINQARGCLRKISDRFDLTLECVRRHYKGVPSHLEGVFLRYASFFALFRDFDGFTEFFLLHDLVTEDRSSVRFFMPFSDFAGSAIPSSVEEFRRYRTQAAEFIRVRAQQMRKYLSVSS